MTSAADISTTTVVATTTTAARPIDSGPNTPTGHVILDGLPGATERCSSDGNRLVSVDWRSPEAGEPLPLHLSFTGAGGNYAGPHPFD
ncbi:MAG: hypothetical protein ACKOI2_05710, partial [Actinomycetota bacterium]